MLTVLAIISLGALACSILSARDKCPLWIPVFLVSFVLAVLTIAGGAIGLVVK